jgi:hypothetical protein
VRYQGSIASGSSYVRCSACALRSKVIDDKNHGAVADAGVPVWCACACELESSLALSDRSQPESIRGTAP